jgi:hypothetical protein
MSIKDELERTIKRREEARMAERDRELELEGIRRKHMETLKPLLKELVEAVDPRYVRAYRDYTEIMIGYPWWDEFRPEVEWYILPVNCSDEDEQAGPEMETGFEVRGERLGFPELKCFETANELMAYLMQQSGSESNCS